MLQRYVGSAHSATSPREILSGRLDTLQVAGDFDLAGLPVPPPDPRLMTQEEKDRGLGSVFKRDDQRLQQLRERDSREKDPNFISESYSECYPGYQEYNREIVESDDDEDLTKMDMGGRVRFPVLLSDFGVSFFLLV
jgi:hypothetical protein